MWGLWALGSFGSTWVTGGTPFSFQSSQKSCEPESSVSASQSLLEEAGPEPLSWHPQASSPRASEPFSSLDHSHGSPVALEYLPFFRTYGNLLAVEELAPRPEVSRDQGGDQNIRDVRFPKDSEPPSGFFPLYRSKEECFPRLALPGSSCGVSQDPCTRKEALAGRLCRVTVSGGGSVSGGGLGNVLKPLGLHSPYKRERIVEVVLEPLRITYNSVIITPGLASVPQRNIWQSS